MQQTSGILVRATKTDDLPALRQLIVATWHDTYDATMGAERVTAITNDWHSPENLRREIGHPKAISLIAEAEGRLQGHALITGLDQTEVTLNRLYVSPDAQRGGVGSALMKTALQETGPAKTVTLEVEEANTRAQRFYAKHGFELVERKSNCGDQDGIPTLVLSRTSA